MTGKKKLKSRAGFTLAETLMAVAILLLVSGIVAAGIPAAKNAYEKVILASNAEVLLSTAESSLRDELGTAWKVKARCGGGVTYFSADTGTRTELYVESGRIKVKEYVAASGTDILFRTGEMTNKALETSRELVFTESQNELYVTCISIEVNPTSNAVEVTGLGVAKTGISGDLVTPRSFSIPVFSKEPINLNGD